MVVKKGYKPTEIGVIPEDWDIAKSADIIDLLTGFPFPSGKYSRSGVRLLRGSNVKRNRTDWADEITQYWPTATGDLRRYLLKEGDIVVAMDGSLVGRSFASIKRYDIPALLLQRVARIRSDVASQRYLKEWFCSQFFTDHCDAVKTTTAIPHISPADIKSFTIPLPPTLAEQEAIAGALSDTDAWIESLEQLIAKKRQIKQGAMQELLTGKRRLPGFSGEWETKRLGDIGSFLKGSGIRKNEANSGEIPSVRYGEIYTHHNDFIRRFYSSVSRDVANTSTRLDYGDLLFAGSGETKADIGKCVAYAHQTEAYAGGDIVILRSKKINPIFMGYYCNTKFVTQQKAARGQGDAVVHISSTALANLEICTPFVQEQTAISNVLIDMDTEIESLESKLAKAREIKQGMMQELLTGRIRLI